MAEQKKQENNKHSADVWVQHKNNCFRKTYGDMLKAQIKSGEMTVYDSNHWNETLLLIAAKRGAYDLAQFLINNGAEIDHRDNKGKSALDHARKNGYAHIEKLLLFAKMNVEAGNEVQNIAGKIQRQSGINEVLSNELGEIGEQSKKMYEETLMELMIGMIAKKKTFCDNQLVYAFNMALNENEHILKSKLWLQIRSTVTNIVQKGSKLDWTWLKECLLPSTIWYKDIANGQKDETHFLYFELLKLVSLEAMNQINELDEKLMKMANEQKDEWNALTKWDIPNEYDQVRQDKIPSGIVSQYTKDHLSATSNSSFNAPNFYDHHQYLSQLSLLAQIVDDEFHKSVQDMFAIDKVTNKGTEINTEYMRGPVKLIERARAKAQNDYAKEPFPTSACVLDFNRCALIFDDISSLLKGLKVFVHKIKQKQSGNIIGIARDKNGFIEYVKEAQYADIKLNVVIKGRHNSIIGEVQFLLRAMKEYKDKAHNLYAIQRKEESIKTSISASLPILLNREKEILSIGCRGNVKQMCSLMVLENQTIKDLMFVDAASGNTIFHRICNLGHLKLLSALRSMMSENEFIKHVFLSNTKDVKCIEYAVRRSQFSMVQWLFSMNEVQQRYKDNDPLIFRLCHSLFVDNSNGAIIKYVLSALNISQEKVVQMLSYVCPKQPAFVENNIFVEAYHKLKIINLIVRWGTMAHLQRLIALVGEAAFVQNVFNLDGNNRDAMFCALEQKNMKFIEYFLSFDAIKEKYLLDNALLARLVKDLNQFMENEDMVKYICDTLSITKKKLESIKSLDIDISKFKSFAR